MLQEKKKQYQKKKGRRRKKPFQTPWPIFFLLQIDPLQAQPTFPSSDLLPLVRQLIRVSTGHCRGDGTATMQRSSSL
jgi:hypothetical protein